MRSHNELATAFITVMRRKNVKPGKLLAYAMVRNVIMELLERSR